jgi:hypothetical protein
MAYRHTLIAFTMATWLVPFAWAHEGSTHVMGTVTESRAEQLVVKAPDGKTVSIVITPHTRYLATGTATTEITPKVGDRVVVELSNDTGSPTASEVRFSSKPKARTP